MNLTLQRYSTSDESTLGLLSIDGRFVCYTIEDAWHVAKIEGQTRIPEGSYAVILRNDGGMTTRYAKRYPEMHQGMLWLQDVPEFSWVYFHVGNRASHSEGCILVGDSPNNNQLTEGYVGHSGQAYTRIYPPIAEAILAGEDVQVMIT